MRKHIDDYKAELVGSTVNWLTIIDIIKNPNGGPMLGVCKCKCGKTCAKPLKHIISGHTKSCGCYNSSKEKGERHSKYYKDNPECIESMISKLKDWRANNPDKTSEMANNISLWYSNNKDKLEIRVTHFKQWCSDNKDKIEETTCHLVDVAKQKRLAALQDVDLSFVHPDDLQNILLGNVTVKDKIRTLCPVCNEYSYHTFSSILSIKSCVCRNRVCKKCVLFASQSKPESDIAEFVATFYNGPCIRNSRDVISPLELDLYYPEKKIAIEFNGDYWHSELFKDNSYHYSKFDSCRLANIKLVSIFESHWNTKKEDVKCYLQDLFFDKENKLSFNRYGCIDNNYPTPNEYTGSHIEDYYYLNDNKVYTCGYTLI